MTDDYPATLREALTRQRRQGVPFERAWTIATVTHPPPNGWGAIGDKNGGPSMTKFLHKHFRAAYNRDSSPLGRFHPTETEASSAVRSQPRVFVKPAPVSCRSGDGCSKPAKVGRFGPTFCVAHGAELAAMALVPYEGFADRAVA